MFCSLYLIKRPINSCLSREDLTVVLLQLCHTLKLEDDTLPTLTNAVINKLQQLREEKEVSVGVSVCLSASLSVCLSVCLSAFLSVCWSGLCPGTHSNNSLYIFRQDLY